QRENIYYRQISDHITGRSPPSRRKCPPLTCIGRDPSEAKQQEKRERQAAALNTFEAIARRWHTNNLHRWKENHAARIIFDFEKVFPLLSAFLAVFLFSIS
ncbi:hypothetical protein HMPREF3156_01127, partial [Neisseria sp. HMSC06F02]